MRVSRSVNVLSKVQRFILWWNFHQIFIWKCVNDMCRHCSFVEWYTRVCAWLCECMVEHGITLYSYFVYPFFTSTIFFPTVACWCCNRMPTRLWFWWNHLFGKNWFIPWDSYECHEIVSTTKTICHNRMVKTITLSLSSPLTCPLCVRIVESMFVGDIAFSQPHPLFLSIESQIRSLCAVVQETSFFLHFPLPPCHHHSIRLHTTTVAVSANRQKWPYFKCSQTKVFV